MEIHIVVKNDRDGYTGFAPVNVAAFGSSEQAVAYATRRNYEQDAFLYTVAELPLDAEDPEGLAAQAARAARARAVYLGEIERNAPLSPPKRCREVPAPENRCRSSARIRYRCVRYTALPASLRRREHAPTPWRQIKDESDLDP